MIRLKYLVNVIGITLELSMGIDPARLGLARGEPTYVSPELNIFTCDKSPF